MGSGHGGELNLVGGGGVHQGGSCPEGSCPTPRTI